MVLTSQMMEQVPAYVTLPPPVAFRLLAQKRTPACPSACRAQNGYQMGPGKMQVFLIGRAGRAKELVEDAPW